MHVVIVYRGRYHIRQALELETLSSVLHQEGHRVTLVYDSDVFGITDNVLQFPLLAGWLSSGKKTVHKIENTAPDAVLFSALPNTYQWLRQIAEQLKARISAPFVFIGLHPTLVPERVMQDPFVDFVIQGEVEYAVPQLLFSIEKETGRDQIGNLWHRKNGQIENTFRAGPVDLDKLPLPDKELFQPYVSHSYSYVAMVSRGCPYQCSFCEETSLKNLYGGHFFRRKKVESVMRELIEAKNRYNFREVIFKDSYLSGNVQWLEDLMGEFRKKIGAPFKCFCTISGFNEKTARLLKEGGCYCVEFGLQTWNELIRHKFLYRRESNKDATEAFAKCAEQKLWYDVDHMLHLPGETEQDHITGALNYHQLRYLNRVKVHHLVYLPSAKIIDHALQTKTVPENIRTCLEEGWESDFYDQGTYSSNNKPSITGFETIYKLVPLIPGWLLRWVLGKGRARLLCWVPSPLITLLQGFLALRSKDRRFYAYLHFYPNKVYRALYERLS